MGIAKVNTARRRPVGRLLLEHPVLVLSLVLFLAVLPVRPEMASAANLEILLLSASLLLVLALGQMFVLITGGIDLSIPAVISLASVVGTSVMAGASPTLGSPASMLLGGAAMLLVGMAVGLYQGLAVSVLKMPAFLVSLASLIFLSGFAVWYTQSARIAVPPGFVELWYGRWLGIPRPVLLVGALAAAAHVVLGHTVAGRRLYAIGHSLPTSVVSGVPVVRVTCFAYMASGLCAAIAALLYTARLYTGSPQLVQNEVLLDSIGAAVIGGTSLFGGKGRVAGTLMGAVFIALVGNSLNMLGLRFWHVIMVKGGVILLAALVDSVRNRWLAGD